MSQPLTATVSGALSAQAQYPTYEMNLYDVTNTVPSFGWNELTWYSSSMAGTPDEGVKLDSNGWNTASGIVAFSINFDWGLGGLPDRPAHEPFCKSWEYYMKIPASGEPGYVAEKVERTIMLASTCQAQLYFGASGTLPQNLSAQLVATPGYYTGEPAPSGYTNTVTVLAGYSYPVRVDLQARGGSSYYKHIVVGFRDVDPSGSIS
jgi:hypothetical protein